VDCIVGSITTRSVENQLRIYRGGLKGTAAGDGVQEPK
jgi:hypothetical protein